MVLEEFNNGFALTEPVGNHVDWYDGGAGPAVNSGIGVAGSVGLAPAANIFTWETHPFNWNDPEFRGVIFQMDFQTDGNGNFDDDRIGWMTTNTSFDSVNFFGVQLDSTEDGGIVSYWRDSSGNRVQEPIVPVAVMEAQHLVPLPR